MRTTQNDFSASKVGGNGVKRSMPQFKDASGATIPAGESYDFITGIQVFERGRIEVHALNKTPELPEASAPDATFVEAGLLGFEDKALREVGTGCP